MLSVFNIATEHRSRLERAMLENNVAISTSSDGRYMKLLDLGHGGEVKLAYGDDDSVILAASCFWMWGKRNRMLLNKVHSLILQTGGETIEPTTRNPPNS